MITLDTLQTVHGIALSLPPETADRFSMPQDERGAGLIRPIVSEGRVSWQFLPGGLLTSDGAGPVRSCLDAAQYDALAYWADLTAR